MSTYRLLDRWGRRFIDGGYGLSEPRRDVVERAPTLLDRLPLQRRACRVLGRSLLLGLVLQLELKARLLLELPSRADRSLGSGAASAGPCAGSSHVGCGVGAGWIEALAAGAASASSSALAWASRWARSRW